MEGHRGGAGYGLAGFLHGRAAGPPRPDARRSAKSGRAVETGRGGNANPDGASGGTRSGFEDAADIYRFYELVQGYGPTLKVLINEEFGDGIMSAIDFTMEIGREPDPKGDRVRITMSGKFLPYKRF
jgi:hypothetical protein